MLCRHRERRYRAAASMWRPSCAAAWAWRSHRNVSMTVLVTGASGFVGCHIVDALARLDPARMVIAADRASPDEVARGVYLAHPVTVRPMMLDVTDRDAARALVAETRPTAIVHAAAITPSPEQEREAPMPHRRRQSRRAGQRARCGRGGRMRAAIHLPVVDGRVRAGRPHPRATKRTTRAPSISTGSPSERARTSFGAGAN